MHKLVSHIPTIPSTTRPILISAAAQKARSYSIIKQPVQTAKQTEGIAETADQKSPLDTPEVKATSTPTAKNFKSIAQLDEELRRKMSGIAGDGGEPGVEYDEYGKPADLKRGVRNNMFRYI